MLKKILAVASTVFLFSTGAQAVTFDFTGPGIFGPGGGDINGQLGQQTAILDKGGVVGAVTANSTRGTPVLADTALNSGIGVDHGRDIDAVDNIRGRDSLLFTFEHAVKLISVTIKSLNLGTTDWDIWVNGSEFATGVSSTTFNFGHVLATSFEIKPEGRWDALGVKGFTVAPIPLPASALLLIGGLAGFGVMRRRKQMMA